MHQTRERPTFKEFLSQSIKNGCNALVVAETHFEIGASYAVHEALPQLAEINKKRKVIVIGEFTSLGGPYTKKTLEQLPLREKEILKKLIESGIEVRGFETTLSHPRIEEMKSTDEIDKCLIALNLYDEFKAQWENILKKSPMERDDEFYFETYRQIAMTIHTNSTQRLTVANDAAEKQIRELGPDHFYVLLCGSAHVPTVAAKSRESEEKVFEIGMLNRLNQNGFKADAIYATTTQPKSESYQTLDDTDKFKFGKIEKVCTVKPVVKPPVLFSKLFGSVNASAENDEKMRNRSAL
jgi:hypothetical protein